jgi:hypothetical protein
MTFVIELRWVHQHVLQQGMAGHADQRQGRNFLQQTFSSVTPSPLHYLLSCR